MRFKHLILFVAIIFFIGQASATVQVVASDTIRNSSDDEWLSGTNSEQLLKTFYFPSSQTENITGTVRISFDMKLNTCCGGTAYGHVKMDDVEIGITQSTTNTAYSTFSQDIPITIANNTVKLELWGSGFRDVRNFRLMYDGLYDPPAPTNLSYTYNSTGINFTWLVGIGNITNSYNFSYTGSYGQWVSVTNISNHSFVPAMAGRNVSVRVYAVNGTGTNVVSTNTSYLSGYAIKGISNYLRIGGTGYNWTVNTTTNDNTVISGTNSLNQGLFIKDFEDQINDGTSLSTNPLYIDSTHAINSYSLMLNQSDAVYAWDFNTFMPAWNTPRQLQIVFYDNSTNYNGNSTVGMINSSGYTTWANGIGVRGTTSTTYYTNQSDGASPSATTIIRSVGWHTVIFEWDGTNMKQYLDGTLIRTYGFAGVPDRIRMGSYWTPYNPTWFDNIWVRQLNQYTGNRTITEQTLPYPLNNICFAGSAGGITLYLNTSNDGVNYTGFIPYTDALAGTSCFNIQEQNKQTKVNLKININSQTTKHGLTNIDLYYETPQNTTVSGYVKYQNGTAIFSAKVVWANETVLTDSNGFYQLNNIWPGNITIVAGKSGLYSNGSIFNNSNGINSTSNFNFTLIPAPVENPNQLQIIGYNITRDYIPYINKYGHLENLPYNESDYLGFSEGYLSTSFAISAVTTNFTPEYLEIGLRLVNHLSELIQNNSFGQTSHENVSSRHTEFMMLTTTYSMKMLQNTVTSVQYELWNSSLKTFNDSWYSSGSIEASNSFTGYLTSNWYFKMALAEIGRKNICGSCVNDTKIQNIIQKYNNSVTSNGYPQGAELSSNYNTVMYTEALFMQEQGYNSDILNNTISLHRPAVLNASMQDGHIMNYYRSAGYMAAYAQNIYNLMRETENRGQAYRYADLQYQKIFEMSNDIGGFYPTFHFFNPESKVGFADYTRKNIQDTVTSFYISRAGQSYSNSIVEESRQYLVFKDLIDGEITSDILYNSSGVMINHPLNYSVYVMTKQIVTPGGYPFYNGSSIIPGYPIITIINARNFTVNPMPEVSGGFLGDTRDMSYAFPITFNNRAIRTSLNFSGTRSYGNVSTNILNLNLTNLNFSSKFIQSYNLTTEYNSTTEAIDVIINLTWDNSTYPLTHFEYGIPFIIDDNRTQATVSGNASVGTINFNRGADTVNISNIQLTNATGLTINTSTGLIGYVPFGKSEITTIEGAITQSPLTLKYTHKVSTTNVYGYGLNQPPGILTNSTNPYNTTTDQQAIFSVNFTQNLQYINWTINGIQVQSNTSVNSATYTNSSSVAGNYTVNATGSNAQGNVTMSWEWNVAPGENVAPIISFISPTPNNATTNITQSIFINTSVSDANGDNMTSLLNWNNSLVGWWRMNEGSSGTNVLDSSGTNLNGTWYGNASKTTIVGKFGDGLNFTGIDDYVDLGDLVIMNGGSQFTIEGWFKFRNNNSGVSEGVFGERADDTNDLGMRMQSGKFYLPLGNGANSYAFLTYGSSIRNNVWHHIVYQFNGTAIGNAERLKLFIDSTQKTLTFSGTIPATTSSSLSGDLFGLGWYTSTNKLNASVDEFRIWNRALSTNEINASYSAHSRQLNATFNGLVIGNSYTYQAFVQDTNGSVNQTELRTISVINESGLSYFPPAPTTLGKTLSFSGQWVNTTWGAESGGNLTDSFNVSIEGIGWYNGTNSYYNHSGISENEWSNITVWAWNSTNNGALSTSSSSLNTQMVRMFPIFPKNVTVSKNGNWLNWTWDT